MQCRSIVLSTSYLQVILVVFHMTSSQQISFSTFNIPSYLHFALLFIMLPLSTCVANKSLICMPSSQLILYCACKIVSSLCFEFHRVFAILRKPLGSLYQSYLFTNVFFLFLATQKNLRLQLHTFTSFCILLRRFLTFPGCPSWHRALFWCH